MTVPYGVVVAFPLRSHHPQPDLQRLLQDAILALLGHLAIDGHGNTDGVVDVAVHEITPGTGNLTSGQWGNHGI